MIEQSHAIASQLKLVDITGQPIEIGKGRKLLLSLFREATCPFCNIRVYELTNQHKALRDLELDVVAVFYSDVHDVKRMIAKQPRPFKIVADPAGKTHQIIGAQHSRMGKVRAMMQRFSAMLLGLKMVGVQGMTTSNLMPVDLLIDESGRVVNAYYGQDAGDHIPLQQIVDFAHHGLNTVGAAA